MPHVVILGGGVIGLNVALACHRQGWQVTVLDQGLAQRDGCSFGNAGMIVPSHFTPLAAPGMVALGLKWMRDPESPFYIQPRLSWDLLTWGVQFYRACNEGHVRRAGPLLRNLNETSRELYTQLAVQLQLDFGLHRTGLLMLCRTQETLDHETHAAQTAHDLGIAAQVYDASQTQALEPDAEVSVCGSVYYTGDCFLSPAALMHALQTRLESEGVQFVFQTQVDALVRQGRKITGVRAGTREFTGDEFVLAAGVWSMDLARQLRLNLPMQAGKGYSLTVEEPPQQLTHCSILTEARVAVTPLGRALRVGGTMQLSGLDASISQRRVNGIVKAVSQYYPGLTAQTFAGITPWSGLRPCSPDGLPYIGRSAGTDNLVVATGHAMMGLSMAPATGAIVASILRGETWPDDLSMLAPDRYA